MICFASFLKQILISYGLCWGSFQLLYLFYQEKLTLRNARGERKGNLFLITFGEYLI